MGAWMTRGLSRARIYACVLAIAGLGVAGVTSAQAHAVRRTLNISLRAASSSKTSGRSASLAVKTATGASCSVALRPPRFTTGFPFSSVTLATRRAGRHGRLSTTWQIPPAAPSGRWTARVACSKGRTHRSASAHFRVPALHVTGATCTSSNQSTSCANPTPVTQSSLPSPPGGFGGNGYPAFGQVVLPGSAWFGGHGVDVHSNGCAGCGSTTWLVSLPTAYGYEWQCVELFERFINTEGWYRGLIPGVVGAQDLYNAAPSNAFDKHPNGSGYVPVPGDAVIFGGGTYGHVAIVNSVGSGSVGIVEENASPSGQATLSLSGSTLGGEYGLHVIGVLHAKANSSPPGGGPGPTGGGPGPTGGGPGPTGGAYEMAFQANTGNLFSIGSDRHGDWQQGMMAGTSPSITALSNGGYEMAFQANTGSLITVGTAGGTNWQQGMMQGTSPSIAP
jgi:CHAP domain